MALSKDQVIKIAKGFLEILRQTHDVRQAYLFGSYAKDTAKDSSDMDLAIVLGPLGVSEESPFDDPLRSFMRHKNIIPYWKLSVLFKKNLIKMGVRWFD